MQFGAGRGETLQFPPGRWSLLDFLLPFLADGCHGRHVAGGRPWQERACDATLVLAGHCAQSSPRPGSLAMHNTAGRLLAAGRCVARAWERMSSTRPARPESQKANDSPKCDACPRTLARFGVLMGCAMHVSALQTSMPILDQRLQRCKRGEGKHEAGARLKTSRGVWPLSLFATQSGRPSKATRRPRATKEVSARWMSTGTNRQSGTCHNDSSRSLYHACSAYIARTDHRPADWLRPVWSWHFNLSSVHATLTPNYCCVGPSRDRNAIIFLSSALITLPFSHHHPTTEVPIFCPSSVSLPSPDRHCTDFCILERSRRTCSLLSPVFLTLSPAPDTTRALTLRLLTRQPSDASTLSSATTSTPTNFTSGAVPAQHPAAKSYASATKTATNISPAAAGASANNAKLGDASVNGANTMAQGGSQAANTGSGPNGMVDHSRKPSVVISASGTTYNNTPNGGPVVQNGRPAINFGSMNAQGSPLPQASAPYQQHSSLATSSRDPRVISPTSSPSPIPHPPPSGGRPPSSLQGQGNGLTFGSTGSEGDVSVAIFPWHVVLAFCSSQEMLEPNCR
nr:hypothetical protein CFP56_20239 [Quercus suber]